MAKITKNKSFFQTKKYSWVGGGLHEETIKNHA